MTTIQTRPSASEGTEQAARPAGRPRLVLASRGDPLTPYLHRALARRYPIAGEINAELSGPQRAAVASQSFHPRRGLWAETFSKSELGYRLRTDNARRQMNELDQAYDAIVQTHALFGLDSPRTHLYVDCTHRQSMQHWPPWDPQRGRARERWLRDERESYHRAAHLFAFCEPTRRSLVADYDVPPERVSVVGAGANLDVLPVLTAPERRREGPVILFLGNDFARKGGPVLLQAFRGVQEQLPNAVLRIAGGRERPPAQPGVEVFGRIRDRRHVEQLYATSDVFCLPSFFDPYPLVLLEAMAFALPCISSYTCGVPEIVTDGETGRLVKAGDVAALTGALLEMLRDRERATAMGHAGRARVETAFTWDHVVDRMAQALDSGRARRC